MIQIYSPGNTNYEMNGDMTLFPVLCDADAELGGAWSLEITHPIDDEGRWKYIEKEAVLSVPTFMGKNQLYRIDEIMDKSDTEISAKAYPIFYDSRNDCFLMDRRPTLKSGQGALDEMTSGTIYSGESNINAVNTAYFVRRNLMDALGGNSPSFIEVWGGEPLYDNFKVILNERAGGDYGAEVRYGKNLIGANASEDMSEVVTRIVPVAYNGRLLSSEYVDSPLIDNYAKVYIKEIKFEEVCLVSDLDENADTDGKIICNNQEELDAALIQKCNEQFEAGIDLFKATIDVELVALENTEEYKDFKDLVRIGLGDDVNCYHTRLGISTKARAIKIKWDCITDSVKEVTLGDYQKDFLKEWTSTISRVENVLNKDGSVGAQYIKGVLDAMNTQLRYQKNVAQKQDVRAILFEDLDPNSSLYGALAIGTQGIQISRKRTADDREWEWTTAITAQGAYANAIITGILSDKTGKNRWNLDTGEFVLEGTGIVIKTKNFNLDEDGNLSISGKYTVEYSRTIYASDYTEADINRIQNISIKLIEPTEEDYKKYDFKGTGIDSYSALIIRKMLIGEVEYYKFTYRITIDPTKNDSVIKTEYLVMTNKDSEERSYGKVMVGGMGIRAEEMFCRFFEASGYKFLDESTGMAMDGTSGNFISPDGKGIQVNGGLITNIAELSCEVLWSGEAWGAYMHENQSIELNGFIPQCPSGIALVFSRYDPDADIAYNEDFVTCFVDKHTVSEHNGAWHTFFLPSFDCIGIKRLYINTSEIWGHSENDNVGTVNGMVYDNNKWVLRYVLRV